MGEDRPPINGQCLPPTEDAFSRFKTAWMEGGHPRLEDYFAGLDETGRDTLVLELLRWESRVGGESGAPSTFRDYLARLAGDSVSIRTLFDGLTSSAELPPTEAISERPGDESDPDSTETFDLGDTSDRLTPETTPDPRDAGPIVEPGLRTDRYTVRRLLGEGIFGKVFLAHDNDLHRPVAIKVPKSSAIASDRRSEDFLKEARLAAGLKHPAIVMVYDVVREPDGTVFVVLEYIEGETLAALLRSGRPTFARLVDLLARIAEAVHYAHTRGLVHRDLKPANIMIDASGAPHVADFGLAIHESGQRVRSGEVAGTPAYMAPEQVRGETHRLDGRTDIWSLGVIFYLMLTNRLPFAGGWREAFDEVLHREPRPPRQIDETIPRELERICLKCLSKRMTERYTTAADLADDLRHWLDSAAGKPDEAPRTIAQAPPALAETSGAESGSSATVRVVPKGLHSFDASDAFFYLKLLPGPVDREGLPPPVRFWKERVEAADLDESDRFAVGLLYGPSGCGKSSMIKAGLIPRLAGHVRPIYLEASADETEARLSRMVRKLAPDLPPRASLPELILALREGRHRREGEKVVVFIDQFEQWLHANRTGRDSVLAEALRQCDGRTVQCVLMVRDDFGMAAMRFMNDLEVPIVEGRNYGIIDLFDPLHAAKVLTLFGRAFGRLPERGPLSTAQERFIERAVEEMTEDGKIVPVRLALFAEMLRGKPWDPAMLKEVGGAEGIGIAFLEETLGDASPDLRHRLHQQAARQVLKALLPEARANLKGKMTSYDSLLATSGYAETPEKFDDLIRLLHVELRLIMPADPERGTLSGDSSLSLGASPTVDGKSYQLTHDYLVPALRKWLTRKQRETARGRAALLLEERAAVWSARPEVRYLPSFAEWATIGLLAGRSGRTDPQARMMRAATRLYATRAIAIGAVAALIFLAALIVRGRIDRERREQQADSLARQLLVAEMSHVPRLLGELDASRALWQARLSAVAADRSRSTAERTRAHLALVRTDQRSVTFLLGRLLDAEPKEYRVIREALSPWEPSLIPSLKIVLGNTTEPPGRRLRAACALVAIQPGDPLFDQVASAVADALLREDLLQVEDWAADLSPIRRRLVPPLSAVFLDPKRSGTERLLSASLLARFGHDDPELLARLGKESDPRAYETFFAAMASHREPVLRAMRSELDQPLPVGREESDRAVPRRVNAAITLLRLGDDSAVWPQLRAAPDPRVRSLLIHRMLRYGVDEARLLDRLANEPDPVVRQAILLTLGERPADADTLADWMRTEMVRSLFADDPSPGVHSAAEWLLRTWNASLRLDRSASAPTGGWSINGEGQTMVTVRGPITFRMGSSPETDFSRDGDEQAHARLIPRSFAISAHEITVDQYRRFRPDAVFDVDVSSQGSCPMINVTWYNAVKYCRWLSEQEKVPDDQMCYPPVDQIGPGMRLPDDGLKRTGYRLPTEAEWEAACRAGTESCWSSGRTEELLPFYAWYVANSDVHAHPVGTRRPNAWGLFDCIGNVGEWCHDTGEPYPEGHQDRPAVDNLWRTTPGDRERVLRGGAYRHVAKECRSAKRLTEAPTVSYTVIGFRVARTVAP